MKKPLILICLVGMLALAGYICIAYYSYVFAKTVNGEVLRVERVTQPAAIVSGGNSAIPTAQLFSYAIAIRDTQGLIHTASSEDRQWSVVAEKQCVQAKMFPYAPWELDKGGTYFNARLEKIYDCPKK